MSDAILKETLRLVKKDKDDWRQTAKETGLGFEWIRKLAANAIGDPGHRKIVKLHSYLVEKYQTKKQVA